MQKTPSSEPTISSLSAGITPFSLAVPSVASHVRRFCVEEAVYCFKEVFENPQN
jgi:hypothetical protein